MSDQKKGVANLGIFVADLAFRADRLPAIGETIIGKGFIMGPGGKGANQAVASARAGAKVSFISKIGKDSFGDNALAAWAKDGVTACVTQSTIEPTGAAFIFVNPETGENAIIVYPGAAGTITPADVEANADVIRSAKVFVTQLEQPVDAAVRGLAIAREAGVTTVFNPAPAAPLPDAIYPLCDYIAPNETEAAMLTGIAPGNEDDARRAGDILLQRGVGCALITLGARGALYHTREKSVIVSAITGGKVIDTTGAGDAFVGGFTAALSEGLDPIAAVRFGSATAGISITRPGAAASMPKRAEIDALLATSTPA
ncbi:Ribokinase [Hartmannibacter diazotrophicus]|uniref:Ribokinase n=1 Tax=Hartmannibacter diazotrophicus TaxID=1482074 RepID=A0A2C9D0N7_9HYPH|nr:ribokinase [Hartmannibacter diazotrophicus]SON53759.1 Ribokinase [Hartmannibacter diazotrophicus]